MARDQLTRIKNTLASSDSSSVDYADNVPLLGDKRHRDRAESRPAHIYPPQQPAPDSAKPAKSREMKHARRKSLFSGKRDADAVAASAKKERPIPPGSLQCLGLSASAGMSGMGKSRRFVEGEVQFDQICAPFSFC
ncbi:uncharacterized protein BXZ73DRAFT_101324 [Epithele typhae]|uniref:uncharacterized protein n=1 Tax=Epithele typhae TaxID=378194 RepID=UPI002008B719|nr:uncharacterized protein BXZ73DRAFT_101324 [Epithele typhae]KAH9932789.1 hypothetical protein BXZ73DRAFT_101324 [Epithele typhae]